MKKLSFCLSIMACLLLGSSISNELCAQGVVNLSIIVYSNELEPGEKIYLQGDNPRFAMYGPTGVPLAKTSSGIYMVSMKAQVGEQIIFTITRGNYSKVARDEAGMEIPAQVINVQQNILLEYRVSGWLDRKGYVSPSSSAAPTVVSGAESVITPVVFTRERKHTNLKPEGNLLSRDIKVILPDGYNESSERYPVLYVHEGFQVLADEASNSKHKWRIDDLLDQMTANFELGPHILVVINNAGSRTLEGSSHAIAKLYARFVATQLKGFVDQKYRTRTEASAHTYLGTKMGGLVAFILAWEYDNYIGNAICHSPIFEFPKMYYSYLGEAINNAKPANGRRIFLDVGKEGISEGAFPGANKVKDLLIQEGFNLSGSLNAEYDSWQERLKRALRFTLD